MSIEQCFNKDRKPISGAASQNSEKTLPCFDCNICLEFANEPVVTLCGHLYCWPCIYKWFYYQSASLASDEQPQCPVCKAEVSHTTVVPLYGRGESLSETESQGKASNRGINIPQRPPALGTETLVTASNHTHQRLPYRNPYQNLQHSSLAYDDYEEDNNSSSARLSTRMDPSNVAVQMFGEMVYARVFGNSQSLYTYPNSYHLVPNSHPRLRRQHMQADKSLGRVSLFLFCCFLLCLFLF
ncbi:hypothetical protein DCAR_0104351 [Daucus carota subsp. sativus]|uniref:E3 ubiquitin-protein ligase RMA n=1 Tax=Daucus carota subsp. sativus TaxID=79200 RepID=A0AAF0W9V6_DAUCS|nr:PREDICTED: E3 ubiquitin-protein ligase RMA1H1-like [Daucus carota subsp. sativus]XP_017230716.1 PREDICTED: E3 ubiquitin-protein ligase RMA1H1-like [Daucus carota subsp. sativus]WOG85164.1 hypothetical protein DCAR_0104351 [Daucus carota subsp. sativus]